MQEFLITMVLMMTVCVSSGIDRSVYELSGVGISPVVIKGIPIKGMKFEGGFVSDLTEDEVMLRADEQLKNSKGFMLFTVNTQGDLVFVADTTGLSSSERYGLDAYRKSVEFEDSLEVE
jgi:hypothetical protein